MEERKGTDREDVVCGPTIVLPARIGPTMTVTTPALRVAAIVAGAVVIVALIVIALGYPSWMWFPLTISFYGAAAVGIGSIAVLLWRWRLRSAQ